MPKRLTYLQARVLLLVLGVGLAIAQTLLAWERGAAPTEVLAPVLYIPVFAGAIFGSFPGGLLAAGVASLIYGVLLSEQTEAIGMRLFAGLLVNRVATYVFYALLVAIGTRYIESRLRKLELYDNIDDLTSLYNSAFFLQDSDLEIGRSNRYRTVFSVAELTVPREVFRGLPRRRYHRTIRELAESIRNSVRKVDRPVRVDDGERDRFLIILPETGPEGAHLLTGRLREASQEFLARRGAAVDGHLASRAVSYPDDAASLAALRDEIGRLEQERMAIRPE